MKSMTTKPRLTAILKRPTIERFCASDGDQDRGPLVAAARVSQSTPDLEEGRHRLELENVLRAAQAKKLAAE
jgi:hypothetical protein